MARINPVISHKRTPKGEARAESQRERILTAAQKCFVEQGFHAASMANISETAQMSAGLIYRYFENKDAIISAIIERQLQTNRASIALLQGGCDLAHRMQEYFIHWRRGDPSVVSPVLFLEMSAQAGRNHEIAQAMADADRVIGADFHAWLLQTSLNQGHMLSEGQSLALKFTLQCFIDGLMVRAVREPAPDPSILEKGIKLFIDHLFPAAKTPGHAGES
jgi:hypothetical protein